MSDTPDVLDAIACEVGDTFIDCWHMAPTEQWRRIGDALASAGWVLVKAPGLSHGDELVQFEIDPITGEIGTQAAWVRRSVPENGERPHTHTRGIDRGDCPECDAEYGDTDG